MKNFLNIIIALFIISCQSNTNNTTEEVKENLFLPMVQDEITYITKNLEGIKGDKGKDWYTGDSVFYTNWLSGAREELDGNLKKAADYYLKASNTKRYELSTYEVKLSLGRLYIQLGEKGKARKMLTEFKKEAKKDLSGEEVEWGLTDEAKEALTRDIEDCDYLLNMIDSQ